ncbi:hypothetical protein CFAM422_011334 [Trichoderma lentiforme]|uniref:PLAC8 family protein n=1 Tax=Trichoderma lentiforme TaxID=1567552 RepID=A0A9P4X7F1_9HYPO|nr:hypothetical protein CFAM422_011334 [Trichoderma lentiforme]
MSTANSSSNNIAWANGFFDCCSPGKLCLLTSCCPCITYGKTQYRVHHGSLEGYSCCNSSCIVFAIAAHFGLQFVPATMQRTHIREKYNLHGSWLGDFCRSGCCTCCVLMQNEKESEQLGALSEPYRSNTAMVYPRAK